MAYARLYRTAELMLLYPAKPGEPAGERQQFGIAGGAECLRIATVDVSLEEPELRASLARLADTILAERAPFMAAAG
jgi:5-methylcytosine-specific restriction enzyme subunit McrC